MCICVYIYIYTYIYIYIYTCIYIYKYIGWNSNLITCNNSGDALYTSRGVISWSSGGDHPHGPLSGSQQGCLVMFLDERKWHPCSWFWLINVDFGWSILILVDQCWFWLINVDQMDFQKPMSSYMSFFPWVGWLKEGLGTSPLATGNDHRWI